METNDPRIRGGNCMYLVAIHVPIHVDGNHKYLSTEWLTSLRLLRDSLQERFGGLTVIAPSRPYNPASTSQTLERVDGANEGIDLIPSFDNRCRTREYWLRHRKQWREQLRKAVSRAEVVHAGLDDVYRPISYDGFLEGHRQGRATVFVQDTDIALQTKQLNAHRSFVHQIRAAGYAKVFEKWCRSAVSFASLSMLKGTRLMKRYGPYQRNAHLFHDTSISLHDIVDQELVNRRCETMRQTLKAGGAMRFVYCGRLTPRKGLIDSIEIIAQASSQGARVELDIIGDGEQRSELAERIQAVGLQSRVRLLGRVSYGEELFSKLRTYDGLLFTPLAEDTPRMIFDAYAAGLPLIAYDIDYVKERSDEESATWLLPSGDVTASADRLVRLFHRPQTIERLSFAARDAAEYHAAESWYQRRAEWTIEAVNKHAHEKLSLAKASMG